METPEILRAIPAFAIRARARPACSLAALAAFPLAVALGALAASTPAAILALFAESAAFFAAVRLYDRGPAGLSAPLTTWLAALSLGFLGYATDLLLRLIWVWSVSTTGLEPPGEPRMAEVVGAFFREASLTIVVALSAAALARGAGVWRAAASGLSRTILAPLSWLALAGAAHACLMGPFAASLLLGGHPVLGFAAATLPLPVLAGAWALLPPPGGGGGMAAGAGKGGSS